MALYAKSAQCSVFERRGNLARVSHKGNSEASLVAMQLLSCVNWVGQALGRVRMWNEKLALDPIADGRCQIRL